MPRIKQSREEIIERIKAGLGQSRSDIAAIVIFGSFAKDSDYHDIDLLVAVEAIDTPALAERGRFKPFDALSASLFPLMCFFYPRRNAATISRPTCPSSWTSPSMATWCTTKGFSSP